MKFLILASILSFAVADLTKRAAPAVDEVVSDFYQGLAESGSLSQALGVNEKWLDEAGEDIQTELGKHLKEAFDELLEKIKDNVDHGKQVGKELLEKAKEIREKMKEVGVEASHKAKELAQKIRAKAKEVIQKILERLGLGKRNLDQQLDSIARSTLSDFIEKIISKVISEENIQKIRDYIHKLPSESELAQRVKAFIERLSNEDLKTFIRNLFDHKYKINQSAVARGETWDKIKDFFNKLKIKLDEHTKKFGEWVKSTWGKGLEKLKEKYGTVKAIAMEFVAHGKDVSAEVAREALEFFRPYKEDLGTLWDQLVDVAKQAIGHF